MLLIFGQTDTCISELNLASKPAIYSMCYTFNMNYDSAPVSYFLPEMYSKTDFGFGFRRKLIFPEQPPYVFGLQIGRKPKAIQQVVGLSNQV